MTTTTPAPARTRDPIRWPVPRRVRVATLVVHVVAFAAWLGLDVALGVLVFAPMIDADLTEACYRVLPLLFWPIVAAAALCLVSGVAIGWMTRWGVVRHWWVAIKLAVNLVLIVLVAVLLAPGLDAAGQYGRELAAGLVPVTEVPRLFMPPVVSTAALLVATVLSVVKPRGRIRA